MNYNIQPRSFTLSYGKAAHLAMRINPIRVFCHDFINDKIKSKVFRKYISQNNTLTDLINTINLYKSSRNLTSSLLKYGIKYHYIKSLFISLYSKNNSHQIAKIIGCSQKLIRIILGPKYLNISSRSMRCSKIHIQMKSTIESVLNDKTVTEQFLLGYWIDEYYDKYKLCIEIDGAWCHNKLKDSKKDAKLTENGYTVVRIPAYSNRVVITDLLKDYINKIL